MRLASLRQINTMDQKATKDEAPFKFGTPVAGDVFTDRTEETKRIVTNLTYGINTILISPRRLGKTSLVEKAAKLVQSDKRRVAFMDAFSCRSPSVFASDFATAVIRATSSKWEEWMAVARDFLSNLTPSITLGTDPASEFKIAFNLKGSFSTLDEILQLPETIAEKKGIKVVVCIDEFQQIATFDEDLAFKKKLRSIWQRQPNVCYCLYGSQKHLLEEMFHGQDYPFYRFGDIFYLKKISRKDWVEFICRRFRQTGKEISEDLAGRIADLTQCYSSYVQQLAMYVWVKTRDKALPKFVDGSFAELVDAYNPAFEDMFRNLPARQMNLLRAVCDGVQEGLSTAENLAQYDLGTSSSLVRARSALIEKEILSLDPEGRVMFADPIMQSWFSRRVLHRRNLT